MVCEAEQEPHRRSTYFDSSSLASTRILISSLQVTSSDTKTPYSFISNPHIPSTTPMSMAHLLNPELSPIVAPGSVPHTGEMQVEVHVHEPTTVVPVIVELCTDSLLVQVTEQAEIEVECAPVDSDMTTVEAEQIAMYPAPNEQLQVPLELEGTVEEPEIAVVESKKRRASVSQGPDVIPRKKQKSTEPSLSIASDSNPPEKTLPSSALWSRIQNQDSSAPAKTPPSSALWSRLQNQKFLFGDLPENTERDAKFEAKIKSLDPNSTVVNAKTVRHVKCGKEFQMKEPYNTGNFKSHVRLCKGPPKSHKLSSGGMNLISTFFQKGPGPGVVASASNSKIKTRFKLAPCPGLLRAVHSQVDLYLERSGARGGGASSVSALARDLSKGLHSEC